MPPGTPDSTATATYVKSTSPISNIAGYIQGPEGNTLFVIVDRDDQGEATRVTGGHFQFADGSWFSVYLDDQGLPGRMVADEYVLVFENWTDSTVDVTIVTKDISPVTARGLSISRPERIQFLKESFGSGDSGPYSRSKNSDSMSAISKDNPEGWVTYKVVTVAGELATCGAALFAGSGIAVVGTPAAPAAPAAWLAGFSIATAGCTKPYFRVLAQLDDLPLDEPEVYAAAWQAAVRTVYCTSVIVVPNEAGGCGPFLSDAYFNVLDGWARSNNILNPQAPPPPCDQGSCPAGSCPPVNYPSKCCPASFPYYWADGKCHTNAPWEQGGSCPQPGDVPCTCPEKHYCVSYQCGNDGTNYHSSGLFCDTTIQCP